MQTLLNDIELDIQELKCLMQAVSNEANPALRGVVNRNIQQMKARLDALQKLLDESCAARIPIAPNVPQPDVRQPDVQPNDTETQRVNEVVQQPEGQQPVGQPGAPEVQRINEVAQQFETQQLVVQQPVAVEPVAPEVLPEPTPIVVPPASSILAERIKPAADLRRAISLNDLFRFSRELFGGDTARLNEVVERLGNAPSFDAARTILVSEVHLDEENEAVADFVELLRKYFS